MEDIKSQYFFIKGKCEAERKFQRGMGRAIAKTFLEVGVDIVWDKILSVVSRSH